MEHSKIQYKAVLTGWLFTIVPSLFTAYLIASWAAQQRDLLSSGAVIATLIIGSIAFFFTGAYTAARMAGKDEMVHSIAAGIVSVVTGVVLSSGQATATPDWLNYLSWVFVAIAILLGGFVGTLINRLVGH